MSIVYDEITGRLETVAEKIERLEGLKLTAKRAARLEKLYARQERLETRLDSISDQFTLFPGTGWGFLEGKMNIGLSITDSELDPTYSAGDSLIMRVQAVRTKTNGGTQRRTETSTFANGDYWKSGGNFQIIEGGGSVLKDFDAFDQITVSIAISEPGEELKWQEKNVLATQDFDISWYNNNLFS